MKKAVCDLHKPPSGSVIGSMRTHTTAPAKPQLNKPAAFRQAAYDCFTKAADALFELLDALLVTPRPESFPELSCAPVFRRQWPSLYEALQDGEVDREALLDLYLETLPASERPLLVGDHTAWARPQARTLRDRTFEHQPTPIKGQKPITIGHGCRTL
ncbi:MAG: transposase [Acidobacteria bacterium]|nr:transposase [Acidobacteriota bacterium]